jgi:hypothetical protein
MGNLVKLCYKGHIRVLHLTVNELPFGGRNKIIPSRIEPKISCVTFQCCTIAPYFLSYNIIYSTKPNIDCDYSWGKVYRSFKDTVYTGPPPPPPPPPPPHSTQRSNSKSLIGGIKSTFTVLLLLLLLLALIM